MGQKEFFEPSFSEIRWIILEIEWNIKIVLIRKIKLNTILSFIWERSW